MSKDFRWYVMNECSNGKIKPWNIFNNIRVQEETEKLCKKYKKEKMSFDDFKEELRKIIQWQEWSRVEYEIIVSSVFAKDGKGQKIDVYEQVLPNLDALARTVLKTYYPRIEV